MPAMSRTPHWSQHPTEKDDPDLIVADSDPLVASSVRVFCARNSQREGRSLPLQGRSLPRQGRSLPRQGLGPLFQWDVGTVWGSPRRLQVPYAIPRPGVPRHISSPYARFLRDIYSVEYCLHNNVVLLGHARWSCYLFVLYDHNTRSCYLIMLLVHVTCSCYLIISPSSCRMIMSLGHATCSCCMILLLDHVTREWFAHEHEVYNGVYVYVYLYVRTRLY